MAGTAGDDSTAVAMATTKEAAREKKDSMDMTENDYDPEDEDDTTKHPCSPYNLLRQLFRAKIVLYTSMLTLFFQMLSILFVSIFSLNLKAGDISPDVAVVFVVGSPILAIPLSMTNDKTVNLSERILMTFYGVAFVICRLLVPFYTFRNRAIVAGFGVAFWWLWFTTHLVTQSHRFRGRFRSSRKADAFARSLVLSILLNLLFRSQGTTLDATYADHRGQHWWAWVMGAIVIAQLAGGVVFKNIVPPPQEAADLKREEEELGSKGLGGACQEFMRHLCIDLDSFFKISAGPRQVEAAGVVRTVILCFGVSGLMFYFCANFTSPVAIVRWVWVDSADTRGSFQAVWILITIMYTATILLSLYSAIYGLPLFHDRIGFEDARLFYRRLFCLGLVPANALFILFFVLTTQQQHPIPRTFFAPQEDGTAGQYATLYLALILSPVMVVNATLIMREIFYTAYKHPTAIAVGLTVANFVYGGLSFSLVLTIADQRTPIENHRWRDTYSFIVLVLSISVFLPVLFVRVNLLSSLPLLLRVTPKSPEVLRMSTQSRQDLFERPHIAKSAIARNKVASMLIAAFSVLLAVTVIANVAAISPTNDPSFDASPRPRGKIRVATYNIHLGFNRRGNPNLLEQARELRSAEADVVVLTESDSASIQGGLRDSVLLLAQEVGYEHHYYGSQTGKGFFGVGILSRYPLRDTNLFFVPGIKQEAICATARLTIPVRFNNSGATGNVQYHLFAAHWNTNHFEGGAQMKELVEFTAGVADSANTRELQNVIITGDFNYDYKTVSPAYNISTRYYKEAWPEVYPGPNGTSDPTGVDPATGFRGESNKEFADRLDMFFLSPSIKVDALKVLRAKECSVCALDTETTECLDCSESDHLPVYIDVSVDL